MSGVAIGIACAIAVLTLVRLAAAAAYLRSARKNAGTNSLNGKPPRVSVLLPVRGNDPTLKEAVLSVLAQNYPNFRLWVVVDSKEDPAWKTIQTIAEEINDDRLVIHELKTKRRNCSLLCSTVLEFWEQVKEHTDLIAFCASDGVVPPNWLQNMVAALQDPQVGSTLGNRWFAPPQGRWGSLVRYLWNVSATVYMWRYQVPWSGAIALRVKDVQHCGLTDHWAKAMIEDAHVGDVLARIGLKMKFVPELIVLNREETSLTDCFRFLVRQFFWTQVYHSKYVSVFSVVFLTGLLTLAPLLLIPLTLWQGAWFDASLLTGALAGQIALLLSALPILDREVLIRSGFGQQASCLTLRTWLKLPAAVVLAQLMSFGAVIAALFVREVDWRGVRYRVKGPWECELLEYVPYTPPEEYQEEQPVRKAA